MKIERIIITGRLYKEMESILSGKLSKQMRFISEEEVTDDILQWADAYVAFRPAPGFQFYNIKWVHCLGAGVDGFLYGRDWKKGVVLTRTNASFGAKISEYCLSYILANLQHHSIFQGYKEKSQWMRVEPIPLNAQRIVIFGTGVIGQEVARTLKGFGINPVGISLSGMQRPFFTRVVTLPKAEEELSAAHWVINTLPLTAGTENIFNDQVFKYMNNAGFINVGRGAAVDEGALVRALEQRNLRLAVLDVFHEEPLPEKSILWTIPNISITPHIAAITSPEEAANEFICTLEAIEREEFTLPNQVDPTRGY